MNQSFCQFNLHQPQPLVQLVSSCLRPDPKDRPNITTVLSSLESMRRALRAGNLNLEEEGNPVASRLGVRMVRTPVLHRQEGAGRQVPGVGGAGVGGDGAGAAAAAGTAGVLPGQKGPESPLKMDLGRALVLSHSSHEGVASWV